ncbi:MAG: ribose-phosphate pyrophosphokinase [Oscillospiraceae bacterium]|jgi:ribose-phosphate pyrophosphokinase|nr:ribose-phosphate pyrophosphokinase [Oscillospiraceae bacterium]
MIDKYGEILTFAGSANRAFADKVTSLVPSAGVQCKAGNALVKSFADGEASVSIYDSVRGKDCYVIQSTCKPVNDNLMALLVMIDALRRASAERITAVIPYFGYARQDRKAKSHDPISAKLVANLITVAGADRVLTMDLHAAQIQGFFDIPVDDLRAAKLFADHFLNLHGHGNQDFIVVAPDAGSVARSRNFAERIGVGLAIVDKRREVANQSEVKNVIGNVSGKKVILFDDMVDTAGSLCGAAKVLVEEGGATEVYAYATHGVLSLDAIDKIESSVIKGIRFIDTIPYPEGRPVSSKISYISAADLFACAIRNIHCGEALSELF